MWEEAHQGADKMMLRGEVLMQPLLGETLLASKAQAEALGLSVRRDAPHRQGEACHTHRFRNIGQFQCEQQKCMVKRGSLTNYRFIFL